jgi:hypothetical protein
MHLSLAAPIAPPSLPITATAPPGANGFLWMVSVLCWLAFLVCLAGFLKGGGHLAWAGIKPNQGHNNGAADIAFSAVGLIITASASVIMTTIAALAG